MILSWFLVNRGAVSSSFLCFSRVSSTTRHDTTRHDATRKAAYFGFGFGFGFNANILMVDFERAFEREGRKLANSDLIFTIWELTREATLRSC